jgi:hypothetical protein
MLAKCVPISACLVGLVVFAVACGRDNTASVRGSRVRALSEGDDDEQVAWGPWSPPVHLGPSVNSPFNDYHPAISPDGLSLYFTSDRPGGFGREDIWVSRRASIHDEWGEAQNLGPVVNAAGDSGTGVPSFSPDGHRMFFSSDRPGICGISGKARGLGAGGDLFVSYRVDTDDDFAWQAPRDLGCQINDPRYTQCGPTYFEDEETGVTSMYFCSPNRPDGLGDFDIYVSKLGEDGVFGPGVLVRELSSPFRDTRTAVRRDGLEIFVTSNRPGSIGTLDIWVSTRRSTEDPWSVPVNAGPIINAAGGRQGAPALSRDGTTMYFYAEGRPDSLGGRDLYVTQRRYLKSRDRDGSRGTD